MQENSNPLVSIIVITYNSSKYVLETLESAKAQTYQNIEIIISDDCSSDNTIEICKRWIEKNNDRFVRAEIITTERNTGIAPNCNRGANAAKGEWLKLIAGDDIFKPDAIYHFTQEAIKFPNKVFFYCPVDFIDSQGLFLKTHKPPVSFLKIKDASKQLKYLLKAGTIIAGPTFFLHKKTLVTLGGFDNRYPFVEDFPLLLKYTNKNYELNYIDIPLIEYRQYSSSVTQDKGSKFYLSFNNFEKEVIIPLLKEKKLYFLFWHKVLSSYISRNVNDFPFKYYFFRILFVALFDPYRYILKVRRYKDKIFYSETRF